MSEIKVTQAHTTNAADAIGRIGVFEDMLKKYGVKTIWKGNKAKLKGTGLSGFIDVTGDAVTVVVKLGMMAKAVGVDPGKLEHSISKRLKAALE